MENLPFILGVITPPLIYALIIYLSAPLKSLNWKSSLKAIAAGVASVTVVYTFNAFFLLGMLGLICLIHLLNNFML